MKGNEDEWGPRVEPYTQEENDAEMKAVKSVGNADSARKMYDDNGWGDFISTFVNNMHIVPEELQTTDDFNRNVTMIINKVIESIGSQPGDYDVMKNVVVKKLKSIRDKGNAQGKGPNFANPGKPASVEKTAKKVNKDRFDVNRFVGNVRDNLLGM